jgi:hypothetical protein
VSDVSSCRKSADAQQPADSGSQQTCRSLEARTTRLKPGTLERRQPRRIVWRDMVTSRFRDGLIAEEWAISDLAERLLLARKH